MEEALLCEVCTEEFSEGLLDPLVLPCGHTFCRSCLLNIKKQKPFTCPSCRTPHADIGIDALPVNYKLLSLAREPRKPKFGTCNDHEDKLTYWCKTCQSPLCVLCIFNSLHQGHTLVKGEVFLEEKEKLLEFRVQKWITENTRNNQSKLLNILTELKSLSDGEALFSKAKKDLGEFLMEIRSNCSYETILAVESKIDHLITSEETFGFEEMSIRPLDEEKGETAHGSAARDVEDSSCVKLSSFSKGDIISTATMKWHNEDGVFKMVPKSDLLFKLPTEVFLDLGTKNGCLGRVIIQPWYHLRRAQQFTAMCLGTFGVSYLGTTFMEVAEKGQASESLVGGWYISPYVGAITLKSLMTDLEWGGEASGEAQEGTVHGRRSNSEDSMFGICTRGKKGGTFNCPFGKVVHGLDVVKKAVQYNPVKEVTITHCGIIIPNLEMDPSEGN